MNYSEKLLEVFDEQSGINIEKLFVLKYGEIPNLYNVNLAIDLENILKKLSKHYELSSDNFIIKAETACRDNPLSVDYKRSFYLIELKPKLWVFISSTKSEFYYTDELKEELKEVLELLKRSIKPKSKKRKFFLLKKEEGDFFLQAYDIKEVDFELEMYFNDDFLDFHQKVVSFLENKGSGLVLLIGKRGTGKTTYLKYLIANVKKKFVVVPKYLFNALEYLNFYFFISEMSDVVLIVEDCDVLLATSNKTTPLYEFLKNADGLLSKDFDYKIICTASIFEHQIYKRNIEKAPLILLYEFKELSVDKANKLRKLFNIKGELTKPTVLNDVLKETHQQVKERRLGFNN